MQCGILTQLLLHPQAYGGDIVFLDRDSKRFWDNGFLFHGNNTKYLYPGVVLAGEWQGVSKS